MILLKFSRANSLPNFQDHLNREWAEIIPREGTSDPDDLQFRCGDDRADVTPGQSLISMAFVRNHNKLARKLARSVLRSVCFTSSKISFVSKT